MIIYTKLDNYNKNFIYFGENIKNTVIINGKFIRIVYSDELCTLNGIYILVPFSNLKKNSQNSFSIDKNDPVIAKICEMEKDILDKYRSSKTKEYKLSEQLEKNTVKIFSSKNNLQTIIIKISGLWESDTAYGLTYKFINY
tara:strand:+ start:255 stop:677 length:423 start_codon:yes stop_codon:yes gene_type:complete